MAVVKREPGKKKVASKRKEEEEEPREKFVLSDELTVPSDQLHDYIILFTGEKKIGKTSLANMFGERTYFLASERGYGGLSLRVSDIPDWRTARAAAKALAKAGKKYGPIVVDTVDKLYDRCEDYICEKLAIQHLSDEEWGKGYAECKKEFDRFISTLSQIGVGLILISHTEEREVKMRGGGSFDRIVPTMSKQARKVIEPLVDIWCYYTYEGTRRVLYIEGDDYISAGHRLKDRFRTPSGEAVRKIDMGKSAKRAFRNFELAFNNQYEPPPEDREEDESKPKSKKSFKIKK